MTSNACFHPPVPTTHNTGLEDAHGRSIKYRTYIQAISDPADDPPRAWRVWGQQVRDGTPYGRITSPRTVYSLREAQCMEKTLFHRNRRYVERNHARAQLRAASAEEDLNALARRL